MKKIYLQPRVMDIFIEPNEIIASSAFTFDSEGNVIEGEFLDINAIDDAFSRDQYTFWDE